MLRNLIARNVVPHDPEKNMNAAEDFMLLLLHSHVVAAARVLQLENPTTSLKTLTNKVISRFIRLPNLSDKAAANCADGVYYTQWDCCGMVSMTPLRKVTVNGFFVIGNFFL